MKQKTVARAAAGVAMLCLFCNAIASGAGFGLYEGSAAGNADTAGVTAKGGEPGAMFFNPAGITTVSGTQVQMGISVVAPRATVEAVNPYTGEEYSEDGRNRVWPLPHAYVTHQLNDDFWLGFGMYTRFGLGAEFDDVWFGRYNNIYAKIVTYNLNPVLAWKATDKLSLSAGLSVQYFDITLKQFVDAAGISGLRNHNDPSPSPYDVFQEMSADDVGFGFDLGFMYQATEKLSFGAGYHSRIKQECEGDVTYSKPPAVAAMAPALFNNTGISGDVTLPDMVMTAVSYDITDKLTASFGVTYTHWSTYDELRIHFDDPILPGVSETAAPKDWDNCFRYTGGLSYELNDAVTLRASYTYDESPLQADTADYLVPAHDRHIFAIGGGYKTGDWVFDGSYFFEIIEDMDVPCRVSSGVMRSEFTDGYAHCFGLSVTRKF